MYNSIVLSDETFTARSVGEVCRNNQQENRAVRITNSPVFSDRAGVANDANRLTYS
jgi:hypothetical protein